MLLTLHRYILRDLLKTFTLCALALTLLVTMGGGVANLFRGEGLSALDIARLFLLIVPIAATFVLPTAAMFSAAMTYGRLSADNEINACRAAGINIHRLLWSVVLLGFAVSLTTYYCWNYFIPHFVKAAEDATRLDLARITASRLQKNKSLQYGKMCLHADLVRQLEPDPHIAGRENLELRGVAYFEMEGTRIAAEGTAEVAQVHFDNRSDAEPEISADLYGVRTYNPVKAQYLESEHQPTPKRPIPLPVRERLSFLDLPTLRDYARQPATMRDIVDRLRVLRHHNANMLTYDLVEQALTTGARVCTLAGSGATVELTAHLVRRSRKYGDLTLDGPVAVVSPVSAGEKTTYRGATATVMVKDDSLRRDRQFIEIEFADVEYAQSQPAASNDRAIRRPRVYLPRLEVPQKLMDHVAAMPDATLLDPNAHVRLSDSAQKDRAKLIENVIQKSAQIVSFIHFRLCLALSGASLVVLAAMLGIFFRGSHVLTAFGVACLPALFVSLIIMAGHNVANFPTMARAGLGVMWGVNFVLILVTFIVGARLVRR